LTFAAIISWRKRSKLAQTVVHAPRRHEKRGKAPQVC
jgi:hypothetical protein